MGKAAPLAFSVDYRAARVAFSVDWVARLVFSAAKGTDQHLKIRW